jgi:hypothetical protein
VGIASFGAITGDAAVETATAQIIDNSHEEFIRNYGDCKLAV